MQVDEIMQAEKELEKQEQNQQELLNVDLAAAIIGIRDFMPLVLLIVTSPDKKFESLPYGGFQPARHRKMAKGLRQLVRKKAGFELGYVEQLYSFGDSSRIRQKNNAASISIGYLALTQPDKMNTKSLWQRWYKFFPWEDWRNGVPQILKQTIYPLLLECSKENFASFADLNRGSWNERMKQFFVPHDCNIWDAERVLERYEILYEAGLVYEAVRDQQHIALQRQRRLASNFPLLGTELHLDHRRILATAISRLRAKIKYRPLIFDLMSEKFTLYTLQKVVEAIYGISLHKQNFRRHMSKSALLETTGTMQTQTGGRPARLYRFRRDVLHEWTPVGLLPPKLIRWRRAQKIRAI